MLELPPDDFRFLSDPSIWSENDLAFVLTMTKFQHIRGAMTPLLPGLPDPRSFQHAVERAPAAREQKLWLFYIMFRKAPNLMVTNENTSESNFGPGGPVQNHELKVRLVYKVTIPLLIVGLFVGSWATTSSLSRQVSLSYQRALAASSVESAIIALSAKEKAAVSAPTPSSISDFETALKQAYDANATWDSFGHPSIGTTRYLALESRIATSLNSGTRTRADLLNQTNENNAAASISTNLHQFGVVAKQQAQDDFARYARLSLWAHLFFFLSLVLLMGGFGLALYRRERDRRQMSEKSERKIRALLEHGGDAILLVNADGVITFANEASGRLWGVGTDDLLNTQFVEFARTLATPRLAEVLEIARQSPGGLISESMALGDQELRIVEINACDYSGQPAIGATIINIRDITERILTESALEREELFTRDLMEHAPLMVCVTDLDLRLLRVNPSGAQILGRSVEEMLGRTAGELFTSDVTSILEASCRRAMAEGEFTEAQTLVVGDASIPILATYFLLKNASGNPYAVAIVAVDMTLVEELRTIERELRTGFDQMADAMFTSYGGRITSWNPAAEAMFGYAAGDIVGEEVSVLVAPLHRDRLPAVVNAVYAGQSVTDSRFLGQRKDGSTFEGSVTAAPIVESPGRVIGVSSIVHDRTHELEFASQLRTDTLTGLPNREALVDHLSTLVTSDSSDSLDLPPVFYLAKLHMDHFDQLSSVYGGMMTGALVHVVADRIAKYVTMGSFVVRTGPREFALTYWATSREDAEHFIEVVYRDITLPIEVSGQVLTISMTVGVSPCIGADVSTVMNQAALLSRRVRPTSSRPIAFFDETLREKLVSDVKLLDELRNALGENRLVPYFQPIVELATNEIVGFEALARWPHDTLGLVTPDQFISLAEDSGLIIDLGQQIRLQACRQLVEWQRVTKRPLLEMHINVSVHELFNSDFVESTRMIIEETGVDPSTVVFEITESTLANGTDMLATLHEVNRMGLRWSIDDFGTGYSSLSYLRDFPIDSIKIDRSFVTDSDTPKGSAMVKSIIDIAEVLGLSTIAEGVESIEECHRMTSLRAQRGQGYFWCRPIPSSDMSELLKNWPAEANHQM